MSNAIIGFGNQADAATFSGGSWVAAFPLANLANRQIQKVARSTNALAASTTFTAALAASSFIGALSLEGTNASVNATIRWRTYTDAGLTNLVYDSGVLTCYPNAPLQAEANRFQRGLRHIPTLRNYAQYVLCEIVDTGNAAGYFQAGRLFVGDVLQPGTNMLYGASLQLKPFSTVTRSVNGAKYFTYRRPNLTFPIAFGALTEVEAMIALDLQAQVDITGEVLFIWDAADFALQYRKSVFGELAQLDALQYPNFANRAMAFQIEGVL